MNNDVDKNRVEHVLMMEAQCANLQKQLNELKAQASWIPQVESELGLDGNAYVTIKFGNRVQKAKVPVEMLDQNATTDLTNSILGNIFVDGILEPFRKVIEPHVEKLQRNAQSLSGQRTKGTQW